jgi:chromosome segregation protein
MKLKRLVLQGYKSFANRTEFIFDGGITAIVGPNGSGKSNVADALRWVLGEQSLSLLRGRRTADLIFAGSDGRGRLGMAEASLVLDNADGAAPLELAEIAITRRAYRSGENEYYLNGTRVRLREVLELLARAGLDRLSYSVVAQGMVDAALSLSAAERRRLIEEAAGLSLYKAKKDSALAQLAEAKANLLRLQDILAELGPQLERLSQQAKQARQAAALEAQLQQVLVALYSGRLAELEAQELAAAERVALAQFRCQQHERELEELRAALSLWQARQAEQAKALESLKREGERIAGALASTAQQEAVLAERLRLLRQREQELAGEMARLQQEKDEAVLERARNEQALAELQAEQEALQGRIAALSAAAERERRESAALLEQQAQAQRAAAKAQAELAQARAQALAARSQAEQLERESLEVAAALAAAQGERSAAQKRSAELEAQLSLATAALQAAQAALDQQQGHYQELQLLLQRSQEELAAKEAEEKRLRAQFAQLQRLGQELYRPATRAILEWAQNEGRSTGVIGPVSALLEVPAEFERALQEALGPRLQHIVVRRWEDAEKAIAFLKGQRAGRATFLPLDTLRPPPPAALPATAGVIGLGAELVRIPPGLEKVRDYLLNRIIVVEDLRAAREVLKRNGGSYTVVTLAGEVAHSSGSLTGGEGEARADLLALEREKRSLPALVAAARAHSQELRQEQAALAAELERARSELQARTQEVAAVRAQRERLLAARAAAEEQLREALAKERGGQAQLAQLQASREALLQAAVEQEERAAAAARLVEEARAVLGQCEEQLSALAHGAAAGLERCSAEAASLQQKSEALSLALASAERHIQRLEERSQEYRSRQQSLRVQLEQVEVQLQETHVAQAEYQRGWQQLEEAMAQSGAALRACIELCEALEREERARLGWAQELRRRCLELEQAVANIRARRQALLQAAAAELGEARAACNAGAALARGMPSLRELEAQAEALRRQLRELGPVNMQAPAEHEALCQRLSFLQAQREDLERAIASLERGIASLDSTMREHFSQTLAAVNARFGEHFRALFGGGSAELLLAAEDGGVEICVRVPGKRRQDLSLLSGGERALTAAALLLALVEVSGTPFCCLDEVDAMLDEANVGRFRQLLQQLASKTQFIVISHNRATIEAAGIVYGVTMGEDGSSRVLSVRLPVEET